MPMGAVPGRSSRKSPSCFAPSSTDMKRAPVTLPPGRLRLVTRPSLTGSPPVAKMIGTVVVAALAASAEGVIANDEGYPPAKKVRHHKWQLSLISARVDFD